MWTVKNSRKEKKKTNHKPNQNPGIFHSLLLGLRSLVYLYVINYEITLCKITPITFKKVNPYLFTSTVKTLHKTHSSGK